MVIFRCKPATYFRIKPIEIHSWVFGKEYMSYFNYIIVNNYFISHNITLQQILHVTNKPKQREWDGEESNNSS